MKDIVSDLYAMYIA